MMQRFSRDTEIGARRVTMAIAAVVTTGILTLAGVYPAAADDTNALSAVQKAAPDVFASIADATASAMELR
ncbi:hypothetical protein IC744_00115 [Microbacterium hominis]|uniref:hypothetical protein n=1 Tax=Microbacterium TaxID=33882 RepID=UPI00168B442E|nr:MULTISPECIES: hypothetical protein [Microbacterium]QOC24863.1 hypothetical protein IC745_10760 [Microbacterium hominis]QOC28916.1 hypothetical protein IC744_00115 [Microbacterium hominis]QYF98885.1 hypothetical protein KY498_06635 [Microbacterium sp. PAMC21962]